jgi:TRAP-type uncharacterized transport system substrate-binding protein
MPSAMRRVLAGERGITLEVRTSAGSHQNLERLEKGEADVAFVQGGLLPRAPKTTRR